MKRAPTLAAPSSSLVNAVYDILGV